MPSDFIKSERKRIRQLASLAWERVLRIELLKIASAIEEMKSGGITPFEVFDRIHQFHAGPSRDLYMQFSKSVPWLEVCRAHFDGVLTEDDLADASDNIRDGIREFAASFAKLAQERGASEQTRFRNR